MDIDKTKVDEFKGKLDNLSEVEFYDFDAYTNGYYSSLDPGVEIDVAELGICDTDDTICVDLYNGKFYGGVHTFGELPTPVQHVIEWYQNAITNKGGTNMSKKEINEAICDDIQKLASDLTKKREMDKANSSAEDIAKKLGVKLPKSKK